jgi:hypothetical protein
MFSLGQGVPQKAELISKFRSREKELYKKAMDRLYDKDQRPPGDNVVNLFFSFVKIGQIS